MKDEIHGLCDTIAGLGCDDALLASLQKQADLLKSKCWPSDEPCPCEALDGWTYSRILRCFQEADVVVFRPPHHDGWYVFHDASSLKRYMRFLLKHSWML